MVAFPLLGPEEEKVSACIAYKISPSMYMQSKQEWKDTCLRVFFSGMARIDSSVQSPASFAIKCKYKIMECD